MNGSALLRGYSVRDRTWSHQKTLRGQPDVSILQPSSLHRLRSVLTSLFLTRHMWEPGALLFLWHSHRLRCTRAAGVLKSPLLICRAAHLSLSEPGTDRLQRDERSALVLEYQPRVTSVPGNFPASVNGLC